MDQALAVARHERAEQGRSSLIRGLHAVRRPQTVPELMADPGGVPAFGDFPTHPLQLARFVMIRPRFGDIPTAGSLIRTIGGAVGSGLQRSRTAIADALARDQIPVPEEFHTPQGGSTDDDVEPWADEEDEEEAADVVPPPFFSQSASARMSPRISQSARAVAEVVMPLGLGGAAGSAAAAAMGFATMNPVAIGAGMGVGAQFVGKSRSRTDPHTTPMADARASMRSRLEERILNPPTQLEQEEVEVYRRAFEERLNPPHNDTEEEAHRVAWAAVLQFREDMQREYETYTSRTGGRSSGSSGGVLRVRPGTSGASRAERIVQGDR